MGCLVSSSSSEAPESPEHLEEWVWAKGEGQVFRRGCRKGKRAKGKWDSQVCKGQGEGVCGNAGREGQEGLGEATAPVGSLRP